MGVLSATVAQNRMNRPASVGLAPVFAAIGRRLIGGSASVLLATCAVALPIAPVEVPAASALPSGCDWNTDEGVQACMGGGPFDAGKDGHGDTYLPGPRSQTPIRPPTITNPQGVRAVNVSDVYALICNDLDVNGVSVPSVEDIYHVLYVAPYRYTQRDAGRAVFLAVNTACPRHRSAMDAAVRQATS